MGSGTNSGISFARAVELVSREKTLTRQIGAIESKVEDARATIDLAARNYFDNPEEQTSKAKSVLDKYEARYEELVEERQKIRNRLEANRRRNETGGPRF